MPRRRLSPEESDLWRSVASTARPLHGPAFRPPDPVPPPQPEPQPKPGPGPGPPHPARPGLAPFTLGEKLQHPDRRDLPPRPGDLPGRAPLLMDARTHGRMTRGKLAPEARIDLHGMTLAEAHPELIRFILNAQAQDMRLVLVITGKGRQRDDTGPIPQRMGALRRQVPHWLRLPPLGPVVLQVSEAHPTHGGSGACYVYLRRR